MPYKKIKLMYITSLFSIFFALLGFSYNTWRLELSEENNNIRTASFSVLVELAEFEQIIYANHYDQDQILGSPRKAWVKIALICDLSFLISPIVNQKSEQLREQWQERWQHVSTNREAVDELVHQIDELKKEIKKTLKQLQ